MCNSRLRDDNFNIRDAYRYDFDGELMRLAVSLSLNAHQEEEGPEGEQVRHMHEAALSTLNNFVLYRGQKIQERERSVGLDSPLGRQMDPIVTIFATCIPRRWPCESEVMERTWAYTAEEVLEYWENGHPRVFRNWKYGLAETFKWLSQMNSAGYEYVLIHQFALISQIPHVGGVPVSALSFALFLVKKCMEHGGITQLTKTLVSKRDYAEFIADYYSMIRLYNEAFPMILDWRDRTMARHHMIMGARPF